MCANYHSTVFFTDELTALMNGLTIILRSEESDLQIVSSIASGWLMAREKAKMGTQKVWDGDIRFVEATEHSDVQQVESSPCSPS